LRDHEKAWKDQEALKADLERRLKAIIQQRNGLETLLNTLELDLADLQRQLRSLQHEQEYEGRHQPKLEKERNDAKEDVERIEVEWRGLDERMQTLTDFIKALEDKLAQEEREFKGFNDISQELNKRRHAALMKRETALDALESKVDAVDKVRKDMVQLQRQVTDGERNCELARMMHSKHLKDVEEVQNQLWPAGGAPCDSSDCPHLQQRNNDLMAELRAKGDELALLRLALDAQKRELKSRDELVAMLSSKAEAASRHR